jgi:hypothetical protein
MTEVGPVVAISREFAYRARPGTAQVEPVGPQALSERRSHLSSWLHEHLTDVP